jgi:hypothetical protein
MHVFFKKTNKQKFYPLLNQADRESNTFIFWLAVEQMESTKQFELLSKVIEAQAASARAVAASNASINDTLAKLWVGVQEEAKKPPATRKRKGT